MPIVVTNYLTPYRIEMFNELSILGDYKFIFHKRKFKKHPWKINSEKVKFNHYYLEDSSLLKIISIFRSDSKVVLAGMDPLTLALFLLAKCFRLDVYQWTEERESPKNIVRIYIRRLFYPYFDGFISVSSNSKNYLHQEFSLVDSSVKVVLQNPTFLTQNSVSFEDNSILNLLYVGVLEPYKNVSFLIEMLHKISEEEIGRYNLTIVGDGSQMSELNNLVYKLNLNETVFFTGYISDRDELDKYYREASIFCLASHETFGAVVPEAISYNLPVLVSSEVGAALDLVVSGENGETFQHNNLGDAMSKLEKISDRILSYSNYASLRAKDFLPNKLASDFNQFINV